jgi:hypothetical protein
VPQARFCSIGLRVPLRPSSKHLQRHEHQHVQSGIQFADSAHAVAREHQCMLSNQILCHQSPNAHNVSAGRFYPSVHLHCFHVTLYCQYHTLFNRPTMGKCVVSRTTRTHWSRGRYCFLALLIESPKPRQRRNQQNRQSDFPQHSAAASGLLAF